MPTSASSLESLLPGELTLEEKLGGRVYRARRTGDGRSLAVRVVHPRSSELAADFLALAEAASRVRHPALAIVDSFGRLGDGSCYIATELVPGQSLDAWADGVGIPPLPQVVELVRRLCLGLQAALRAGVVHDALNPRNVRVLGAANETGMRTPMKVLDLGVVALCLDHQADPQALRYMAPEQLTAFGAPEQPPSFRCSATMNVYSCGALLYYLTTGGPPFTGNTVSELLAAQAAGRLVPPVRINPQIPTTLNAVIVRALSLDPSERFDSVSELGEALVGLGGSFAPLPRSASDAPEVSFESLQDGPPTFKSPRLVTAMRIADTQPPPADRRFDQHETPTLPPSAVPPSAAELPARERLAHEEAHDVSGVAPIGLFSSSPPFDRKSSYPPLPIGSLPPPRATPIALFSQPESQTAAIAIMTESTALVPHKSDSRVLVDPPRERWRTALPWLLPLSAAACVVLFLGARALFGTSAPAPVAPSVQARRSVDPVQPSTPAEPVAPVGALTPELARELPEGPSASPERERAERSSAGRVREHNRARGSASSTPTSRSAALEASTELKPRLDAAENTDVAALALDAVPPATKLDPPPAPSELAQETLRAPAPPLPAMDATPLAASLDIGSFSVRGSLPSSQVRRAVERLRSSFESCYRRAAQAAGHNGFGELIVDVHIDERGRPSAPRVHGGRLPRLDACVADAVSKLICEKAPDTGTVLASWKLTFTP